MSNNVAGANTSSLVSVVKGTTLQWACRKFADAENLVGEDLTSVTIQAWLYQTHEPENILQTAEVTKLVQAEGNLGRFQILMQTEDMERGTYMLQLKFSYPGSIYDLPTPTQVRIE